MSAAIPPAFAPLPPDLLAICRCPLTHQPLRNAEPRELATLELPAALVREDGRSAFPIRDGIPILLPEAAISLHG